MRYAMCAAVLVAWLLPTAPLAGEQSNRSIESFYRLCTSPETYEGMFCIGYLLGVANTLNWAGKSEVIWTSTSTRFGICDAGYTGPSLRQMYINWAEKNPHRWTEDVDAGIWTAFTQQWPCE